MFLLDLIIFYYVDIFLYFFFIFFIFNFFYFLSKYRRFRFLEKKYFDLMSEDSCWSVIIYFCVFLILFSYYFNLSFFYLFFYVIFFLWSFSKFIYLFTDTSVTPNYNIVFVEPWFFSIEFILFYLNLLSYRYYYFRVSQWFLFQEIDILLTRVIILFFILFFIV